MRYPVLVCPWLKVDGMAVYPFILVRQADMKNDPVLIRHENIHLKQAQELLILPFYLLYLFNYLINRFRYSNHHEAYMNIVFEREAYRHEREVDYLTQRPFWNWLFLN